MINKVGFGRNIDDLDFKKYENGMELTAKVAADHEDGGFYKYIPEREFMEMQKKGFEDNHDKLLEQNDKLKDKIEKLQAEINHIMQYTVDKLKQFKVNPKVIEQLGFNQYVQT